MILIAVIALYGVALTVGHLVSQPLRRRLVVLVDSLEERFTTEAEREHLDFLARSGMSNVVGLLLPLTAIDALINELLLIKHRPSRALQRLDKDPEYHRATVLYVGSVILCSPFAFLFALPAILLLAGFLAVRHRRVAEAIEEPVLAASSRLQSA